MVSTVSADAMPTTEEFSRAQDAAFDDVDLSPEYQFVDLDDPSIRL